MTGAKFTLGAEEDGFFVTVGEDVTVYEEYSDAVTEIQEKVATDTESFLAEVVIDTDGGEDVAVTLEQVSWQQVIQDMAQTEERDGM